MPTRRRARTRLSRASAAVLAVALGLVLWAGPGASAHALPVTTSPSAGQTLQSSPAQVVMTFTERPDPAHSAIEVLDTSGKVWAGPAVQVVPSPPNTLRVPVNAPLPKGVYTVNWKTISTVDGHLATGSFSFGVGETPSAATSAAAVRSPGPSIVAIVARFFYLAGLIVLLGVAFTELVVLAGAQPPRPVTRRLRWAMAAGWVAAFGGVWGMLQPQMAGAGLRFSTLIASTIGSAFLLRVIPVAAAGAGLVALRFARGRAGWARPVTGFVALAAAASMLAEVLKSHAAGEASWTWFRVGVQWVHFAAAGVWVGGLAGLLLSIGPLGAGHRASPAKRFSFWAGGAIAAVGLTGLLRALDLVGSWKGLVHTSYGQLIDVKIVLFALLLGLGARNRFRHVGAVERGARGLLRTGGAELVAMALVLGATGWLQNLAPAKSALATAAQAATNAPPASTLQPIRVTAHDAGDLYTLHLTISPGTAGFSTYRLTLHDYITGAPVTARSVSIGFAEQFKPGLGTSDLALAPTGAGTYSGRGANLGLTGPYTLTITVQNGVNGSVDLPVTVVAESPPQKVQVQHFVGTPTTYTVPIDSGGDVVQIYLDPYQARFHQAEFHVTFLNATGQEITMQPVLAVDAEQVPAGSVTMPLFKYRMLDTLGHYVADAAVVTGRYQFTVAGVTASGTAVGATLTVPVT
jgi:copper transport protein